jgi:hypothetical protein
MLTPVDLQLDLVEVPFVPGARAASAHTIREGLPELQAPALDGLVAHGDPALGQQLLRFRCR